MDIYQTIISIALGMGLAAAAGFRVFIPLLITGLALRLGLGIVELSPDNMWITSDMAILCFAVATIIEVLAYKIPFIDHALDLITTPTAIAVGSLLVSLFLKDMNSPLIKYTLAIILGGGTAGLFQGLTVFGRALSTKSSGGLINPFFALGELFSSILISILSVFVPIICVLLVFGSLIFGGLWIFRNKKNPMPTEQKNH